MEVSRVASMERERAYGKKVGTGPPRCYRSPTTAEEGRRHGWDGTASTNVTGPSWARKPKLVARDQPNR